MIKVELHCHLDGSLNIDSAQEMLKDQGMIFEREDLRKRLEVNPNCTSLTEYLEKFDLPLLCLQTKEGLKRAAYELVRDVATENVKYIEVRFAPMLSTQQGLTCVEVIESVVEGLKKGERAYGVFASAIVCAMRHHPLENNTEMLRAAREFLGSGVCALDLAGDESAFPTKGFRELFVQAKKWEMPFTIHSGECGSEENVKEAIEFGARRMGHGIALAKSEQLQQICRDRRIGVEMCPSSNLQTKAVEDLKDYPLEKFVKKGIPVSINTDNRTVSNTTITKEIVLVRDNLHQSEDTILICMKNAVETAFADDDIKHRLYQMMR